MRESLKLAHLLVPHVARAEEVLVFDVDEALCPADVVDVRLHATSTRVSRIIINCIACIQALCLAHVVDVRLHASLVYMIARDVSQICDG